MSKPHTPGYNSLLTEIFAITPQEPPKIMTPEDIAEVLDNLRTDKPPVVDTSTKLGDITISGPLIKGKTVTVEMVKNGEPPVLIKLTNYELSAPHELTELIENQLEYWAPKKEETDKV